MSLIRNVKQSMSPRRSWMTILLLYISQIHFTNGAGDTVQLKLALTIPWQDNYQNQTNTSTEELTINLRETVTSIYSSYSESVAVQVESLLPYNSVNTEVKLTVSSHLSWTKATQSAAAHHLSSYITTHNEQLEVLGNIYDVVDGVRYTDYDTDVLVDDLCFLYDTMNLCRNDGNCIVEDDLPVCLCSSVQFEGTFCEESNLTDESDDGISLVVIVLICVAALLVVAVVMIWVICRNNTKAGQKDFNEAVVGSRDSMQSGGVPQIMGFPNTDQTVWLTESDQNLMKKEGSKVLNYLFHKHKIEPTKPKEMPEKALGTLYAKKDEPMDRDTWIGSGEYQHSIKPSDVFSTVSDEPDITKPKGILKTGWTYRSSGSEARDSGSSAFRNNQDHSVQIVPVMSNGLSSPFNSVTAGNSFSTRQSDLYQGSRTRVTINEDGETPALLPTILEVGSSDSIGESMGSPIVNIDVNY